GARERDDWSRHLEGGLLAQDQVARVRRAAYEGLLWLADDAIHRGVSHHSGRKVAPQKAARQGPAYPRPAESALGPTAAFYRAPAARNWGNQRRRARTWSKPGRRRRRSPWTTTYWPWPLWPRGTRRRRSSSVRRHCARSPPTTGRCCCWESPWFTWAKPRRISP